jgi:hypothetical protein
MFLNMTVSDTVLYQSILFKIDTKIYEFHLSKYEGIMIIYCNFVFDYLNVFIILSTPEHMDNSNILI